jgi:photosystem II stability/assembly factor-like uncharacterized protein
MKIIHLLTLLVLCACCGSTANAQDWTLTNGPSGSQVRSIIADGTDLYVIGKTVLRSTNSGASWKQMTLPYPTGTPKYIKKQSDGDLYVFIAYIVSSDSVWSVNIRKRSGTDSTTAVYDTIRTFMHVKESFNNSGVYRSANDGQTWDQVFSLENTNTMFIDSHDRLMLTSENQKQYTSTDDGVTWDSSVSVPEWTSAIFEDASGDFFLTTSRAVFRSTTGGASWSKILNGLTDGQYFSFVSDAGGRHFTVSNVGGTFMSSDDGRSWTPFPIHERKAYAAIARNANGTLISGNRWDTTVWISTDNGDSWDSVRGEYLALDYDANSVYSYVAPIVGGASNDFYSGGNHGLWHISPTTYEEMSVPIGFVTGLIALKTGTLVAATTSSLYYSQEMTYAFWRSTNEGASWSRIKTESIQYGNDFHMALDSSGNGYINFYSKLLRTSDDGLTWHTSSNVINPMAPASGLAVGGDGTIYVSTNGEYMLRSTDDGLSWDQLNYGLTDSKLTSIAVSPNNDVYASSEKKIFRSTDAGLTWSTTAFSSNDPVTVLVVSPLSMMAQPGHPQVRDSAQASSLECSALRAERSSLDRMTACMFSTLVRTSGQSLAMASRILQCFR